MEKFDYYFYTQYYEDLKHFKKNEAALHYLKHGKKENRICNSEKFINFLKSINFDYNFYNKLYGLNFKKGIYNHMFLYKYYKEHKDTFKNVTELKNNLSKYNFDPHFYNKY